MSLVSYDPVAEDAAIQAAYAKFMTGEWQMAHPETWWQEVRSVADQLWRKEDTDMFMARVRSTEEQRLLMEREVQRRTLRLTTCLVDELRETQEEAEGRFPRYGPQPEPLVGEWGFTEILVLTGSVSLLLVVLALALRTYMRRSRGLAEMRPRPRPIVSPPPVEEESMNADETEDSDSVVEEDETSVAARCLHVLANRGCAHSSYVAFGLRLLACQRCALRMPTFV